MPPRSPRPRPPDRPGGPCTDRGCSPAGCTRDVRHHPRQTSTVPEPSEPPERPAPKPPREAVQRWRLVLARGPLAADAGQREQLAAWEHALVGSGLPVAGLDATPPRPRFAVAAPLAASIPGEAELVDVWLVAARARVAGPRGARRVDARRRTGSWRRTTSGPGRRRCPGQVGGIGLPGAWPGAGRGSGRPQAAATALLAAAPRSARARKGDGDVRYDLRPFLDGLAVDRRARRESSHAPHDAPPRPGARHRPAGRGARRDRRSAGRRRPSRRRSCASGSSSRRRRRRRPRPADPRSRRGGQPATPASRPRK